MCGGREEGEGGGEEGEGWSRSPGLLAVVTKGAMEEGEVKEERVGGGRELGGGGRGEVGEGCEEVKEVQEDSVGSQERGGDLWYGA